MGSYGIPRKMVGVGVVRRVGMGSYQRMRDIRLVQG